MTEYNLVIEINEDELLADYAKVGSNSTEISLLIESSINCFPGLERIVQINKVKTPQYYVKLFGEVSKEYVIGEIPDDFFVLSEEEQYKYLKDNAWEQFEFDSGEYLFQEIDKETYRQFSKPTCDTP